MPVFSRTESKFRLVLYVKDTFRSKFKELFGKEKNMYVEYSIIILDKRDDDKGLKRLIQRVENTYRGMYVTALIYDNMNNQLIAKWSFDKQVL